MCEGGTLEGTRRWASGTAPRGTRLRAGAGPPAPHALPGTHSPPAFSLRRPNTLQNTRNPRCAHAFLVSTENPMHGSLEGGNPSDAEVWLILRRIPPVTSHPLNVAGKCRKTSSKNNTSNSSHGHRIRGSNSTAATPQGNAPGQEWRTLSLPRRRS